LPHRGQFSPAVDTPDTNSKGSTEMSDSFDWMMIAEIKTLKSVTLWRVGQHAEGPGRRPEEPLVVVAATTARAGRSASTVMVGSTARTSRTSHPPTPGTMHKQPSLV
jgi:hypothetical protein